MPFTLAKSLEKRHLLVQPSDLDFLILSCAILYCFCYIFYTIRTKRDRFLAGPIDLMFGNLAYEIYYPFIVASSKFQLAGCLVWFLLDVRFTYIAIKYACPLEKRRRVALRSVLGIIAGVAFLRTLGQYLPDDGEQVTAYWTGWFLELPVGWTSVLYLWKHGHTKGQSLEIWVARFSGILTAISVFIWRYLNVPQNWAYVGSWPSIALVTVTIIPEVVYPFAFIRAERKMIEKEKEEKEKIP
ncbi:uncharacterized protein BDZ99DRAFT_505294 [Mytilinidion resinicola]|uniref:Uncharacterized protein n=1 Tax=Mytilinidion resinicola TaxID=574789 RepID=A0A6A6ZAB1_9PEZI|nr:uncharacterized protein BDZ99DRAFT_505294 [Mytilinidion resinicola]KAF2817673.1 hypothetical protein BDZ99DRAFT_505294 [Mytilinidion resinicola]